MHTLINKSEEQVTVPFLNGKGDFDKVIVQPRGRAQLTSDSTVDERWLTDHSQVTLHLDASAIKQPSPVVEE